jgi:CRP-like cAMP-binding protein
METGNLLLDCLPPDVMERLRVQLAPVELDLHRVLHRPGEEIRHLYFPTTCLISITIRTSSGVTVEVGAAGSREVVGINAFMGGRETTQTEYIVQVAGSALRIDPEPMKTEFDRNTEFRTVLLRYTQAMIAQISQNVACNRLHQIDARCTRWLLEVRDRVRANAFLLTQEFIAEMLGANRASVNHSMAALREKGIIDYTRGDVSLLDIERLSELTCECYSVLQGEYDRLLGRFHHGYGEIK